MTWTWRYSRWKKSTWTWREAPNFTFTSRFTFSHASRTPPWFINFCLSASRKSDHVNNIEDGHKIVDERTPLSKLRLKQDTLAKNICVSVNLSSRDIHANPTSENRECRGRVVLVRGTFANIDEIFSTLLLSKLDIANTHHRDKHCNLPKALEPWTSYAHERYAKERERFQKSPTAKGWNWATPKSVWRWSANTTATEIWPQTVVSHENEFCSLVRLLS